MDVERSRRRWRIACGAAVLVENAVEDEGPGERLKGHVGSTVTAQEDGVAAGRALRGSRGGGALMRRAPGR
jgi:hypothetical protein